MENTYHAMNPWWEGCVKETGLPRRGYLRNLQAALSRKQVSLVMGGRRVGKTTLVIQAIAACLKSGVPARDILYLAMDHPRLGGTPLSEHVRRFRSLFRIERDHRLVLFFDEVQESPNWESELKSLHDHENVKLTCTGSTAARVRSAAPQATSRRINRHGTADASHLQRDPLG